MAAVFGFGTKRIHDLSNVAAGRNDDGSQSSTCLQLGADSSNLLLGHFPRVNH